MLVTFWFDQPLSPSYLPALSRLLGVEGASPDPVRTIEALIRAQVSFPLRVASLLTDVLLLGLGILTPVVESVKVEL